MHRADNSAGVTEGLWITGVKHGRNDLRELAIKLENLWTIQQEEMRRHKVLLAKESQIGWLTPYGTSNLAKMRKASFLMGKLRLSLRGAPNKIPEKSSCGKQTVAKKCY